MESPLTGIFVWHVPKLSRCSVSSPREKARHNTLHDGVACFCFCRLSLACSVCKRAAALRALIMWMLRRLHHQQAMMSSLQQTPRKSQQAKPRRSISGVGEKLVQPRGPSGGSRASSKQQEVTVISSSSSSSEEEKERPRQLPARPVPAPRGALRLAVFKACDVVLLQLPKVLSFLLPHMTDSFLCTAAEPESAARELSSRITTLLVASTVGPRNEQGCMTEGTEPPSVRDSATGDVHPDNSLAPETSDSHSTCQVGLLRSLRRRVSCSTGSLRVTRGSRQHPSAQTVPRRAPSFYSIWLQSRSEAIFGAVCGAGMLSSCPVQRERPFVLLPPDRD